MRIILFIILLLCRIDFSVEIAFTELPPTTVDSIKEDLNAAFYLLDNVEWGHNTIYHHLSYRYNGTIIIPKRNDNNFSFIELNINDDDNNILLPDLYKTIYENRNDINVILHISNPDIMSISYYQYGYIPFHQYYYRFYPVSYNLNDLLNPNKLYTHNKYPSNVLLLPDHNGALSFGENMHEAFTRLYYIIMTSEAQVITLSILPNLNDIIIPSEDIQLKTIHVYQNQNLAAYQNQNTKFGIPEFNALKRRYGYYSECDHNDENYFRKKNGDNVSESVEITNIRKDLVKLYHVLDRFGWTELIYQHISAKLPYNETNFEHLILNPFGYDFSEANPYNFVELIVEYDENNLLGDTQCTVLKNGRYMKAALELHAALSYRNDTNFAIHIHHPYLSAISVCKYGLLPVNKLYYNIIKPITYHEFNSLAQDQNKEILKHDFGYDSDVLILRNHGIITTGKTAKDAFNKLYYAIKLAELQINIMQAGLLNDEMIQDLQEYQIIDNEKMEIQDESHLNAWKRFS